MRKTNFEKGHRKLRILKTLNQIVFYLTGQVVAAYAGRERFETVPYVGFRLPARSRFGKGRGAPVTGISQSSTYLWAFLSSLGKLFFAQPVIIQKSGGFNGKDIVNC
jgi:hypothetical protein